jgi:hypothetical protein
VTQQARTVAGANSIIELERRFDRLLRNQVPDEQFVRILRATEQEWSHAIWAAAEACGRSVPSSDEVDRGLSLAQRPVFLCGAARSGTTLLRDLLDGHPQLVVIPNESGFYRTAERELSRLRSDRHCSYLGRRWVGWLAASPPFWLLGSSTPSRSPYVALARDYAAWWRVSERHSEARNSSWPLAAFALAYAQRLGRGRLPPEARSWVEKTPGNERSMTRIWQDFPAAKVIHIVRRPEAVLASVKKMTPRRWTSRRKVTHIFGEMAPSYRIAAHGEGQLPPDRYCLIRFEELTADPETVMSRIAKFLGIEPLPSLLQPTVAGHPAFNNTSFATSRPELRDVLDSMDRTLLAVAVAPQAAKLGYMPSETGGGHPIVGNPA